VLGEIGAADVQELLVFNKADLVSADVVARLVAHHPGSRAMSALTGDGVEDVLRAASDRLRAQHAVVELAVPFDRGDVLAAIHREGEVLVQQPGEGAMRLRVRLNHPGRARFQEFVVDPDEVRVP
jgi:GTP-binding protein HflX